MDGGASSRDSITNSGSSSSNPCRCLVLAVKAFLGCLGLDSIFKEPPSKEDEKKATEDTTTTSRDVPMLFTSLDARRRPKRPVIDPGGGGQINSSSA